MPSHMSLHKHSKSLWQTIFLCHVDRLDCFSPPFSKLHHQESREMSPENLTSVSSELLAFLWYSTRPPTRPSPSVTTTSSLSPLFSVLTSYLRSLEQKCFDSFPLWLFALFECWSVVFCGVASWAYFSSNMHYLYDFYIGYRFIIFLSEEVIIYPWCQKQC